MVLIASTSTAARPGTSQGREAGRPARAGADQVRTRHQPKNGQSPRPRRARDASRPRRRGDRMNRRSFITLLCSAAAAWPLTARAQQAAVRPLIGILSPISATGARPLIAAFRSVLRDLGYLEGQNVTIAIRYGGGAPERMVPLSREMIALIQTSLSPERSWPSTKRRRLFQLLP